VEALVGRVPSVRPEILPQSQCGGEYKENTSRSHNPARRDPLQPQNTQWQAQEEADNVNNAGPGSGWRGTGLWRHGHDKHELPNSSEQIPVNVSRNCGPADLPGQMISSLCRDYTTNKGEIWRKFAALPDAAQRTPASLRGSGESMFMKS
jgi:hypothetical protein